MTEGERISREEFDRQLAELKNIEIDGKEIQFVEASPKDPINESVVVVVGGYGAWSDPYVDELFELAKSGRKVLFLSPDLGIKPHENDAEYFDKFKVPKSIGSMAAAVREVLNAKGIEHADFVGHSRGAAVLTSLAASHPELAERLVLINPPGLIGKDSPINLAARKFKEGSRRRLSGFFSSQTQEEIRRLGELPTVQTKAPWQDMARVNLVPLLRDLKERGKESEKPRPEVFLLHAQGDVLFPAKRIEKTLTSRGHDAFEVIDHWSMYTRKKAAHGAPYLELPGALKQILVESDKIQGQEK